MTPTQLSKAGEVTVAYASQILAGLRQPSLSVALRIYDSTGERFGQLRGLDDAEIETARKMAEAA